MKQHLRKLQSGFTLIELVIVITILGILAAIAIPKFASLQAEARLTKMTGAMGSVKSAAAMAHALLIARGFDSNYTGAPGINVEGTAITYVNGYPDAASIVALAGLTTQDFVISGLTAPHVAAPDASHNGEGSNPDCTISYTPPAAVNNQPTYQVNATTANCS